MLEVMAIGGIGCVLGSNYNDPVAGGLIYLLIIGEIAVFCCIVLVFIQSWRRQTCATALCVFGIGCDISTFVCSAVRNHVESDMVQIAVIVFQTLIICVGLIFVSASRFINDSVAPFDHNNGAPIVGLDAIVLHRSSLGISVTSPPHESSKTTSIVSTVSTTTLSNS
jgi:hypothetical protein